MLSFVALASVVAALASQVSAAANISAVIPSSTDKCIKGYESGSDTALITLPYPYEEIVSIIDSFAKPNQWAIPPNTTVVTNGTDNSPGTAREYTLDGVTAIETLETYLNPKGGPFQEIYSAAKLTIPAFNLSIYSDYDSVTLVSACDGRASAFNFTIKMCATNITEAIGLQHLQHLKGPEALRTGLGGMNFTSCAALSNSTSNSTTATASASVSSAISSALVASTSGALASATSSLASVASSQSAAATSVAATGTSTASGSSSSATGAAVRYGGMSAAVAGLGALAIAALA